MSSFFSKDNEKTAQQQVEDRNEAMKNLVLGDSLKKNVELVQKLFRDVDPLVLRFIQNDRDGSLKYCIFYWEGMVDPAIINDSVIKPLMLSDAAKPSARLIDDLIQRVLLVNDAEKTNHLNKIISSVTYGEAILLAEGSNEAVILSTKGYPTRAIEEPENEKILCGPREGFTESLMQNLSMIGRKLRTNELKAKYLTLGKVSQTTVCVCYLDNIVNKNILKELLRRLGTIDMDAVLDTNYIAEQIRDCAMSPFRTTGYTERPDVVVGKLLEGRIAVLVDGSPIILTVPYLFIENFQSNEDYYLNFYYTSFSRMLRIIGFMLTITVPGFYISVVAYHQEMLPTPLLINIANARKNVPLPAALEAFIMLSVFDILREAGVRMPSGIGQALSIVGALVIGQAAVDAKLVASPMIIVVGITGITSLLIPKMIASAIFLRFYLLLLATSFGLYGFVLGISTVLIHITNLTSLGVSQLILPETLQFQDIKDTFIRAPWQNMTLRLKPLSGNRTRMKKGGGGKFER